MIVFYDLLIDQFDLVKLLTSFLIIGIAIIMVIMYSNKEKKIPYYREHPNNLPIPIIQYYDKGKFDNKTIWLMILDMIQKDFYALEKINKNEYKLKWKKGNMFLLDSSNLRSYEENLIKYINSIIVGNNNEDNSISLNVLIGEMKSDFQFPERLKKIYDSIFDEIRSSYGEINYSKNYTLSFVFLMAYYFIWFPNADFLLIGIGYSIIIILMASVLKNLKFNIIGLISVMALLFATATLISPLLPTFFLIKNGLWSLLIYFNPLPIITTVLILKIKFYSEKQKDVLMKIKGVKNFIQDFTRLKEKPIDYIIFVKYYYVLAEAFGIKITDQEYIKTEFDDDSLETLNIFDYASVVSNLYFDKIDFFKS